MSDRPNFITPAGYKALREEYEALFAGERPKLLETIAWAAANGDPRLPGTDILRWIEDIPFSETRNYVQRVIENAVVYELINPNRAGQPPRNRISYFLGQSPRW